MPVSLRVLYVDDDTGLLEIGTIFIEQNGDFYVKTVNSASLALTLLESEKIDAIVSDYQMPGMDGIEFLIQVREKFGSIPFILFTGKGREEIVIQAINNGADFYVQKGGDPESQFAELVHKIRQAIGKREAEKFSQDVISYAREGIIVYDHELRIVLWNKFMETLTGITEAEVLGKNAIELFPFHKVTGVADLLEQALAGIPGESTDFPFSIPSTGKRGWVKGIYTPHYDPSGNIIGVIGIVRDITRRIQAEQALKGSEEKLRLKLDSLLEQDYDIGEEEFANIIDRHSIQSLMDDLYSLTGMGMAILDLKGNVLVATGWQDICTKFHRVNELSCRNCLESDLYLTGYVKPGEYLIYKCKNSMWDMVTPIMIGRKHVGNMFLGQFFFADEIPDRSVFTAQAEKFGFNKEEYLAALDRVPRWSRDKVTTLMDFYTKFASRISHLSYSNLKLAKSLLDNQGVVNSLIQSEEKFREYIEYSPEGIFVTDAGGRYIDVNRAACDLVGYTREELLALDITQLVPPKNRAASMKRFLDLQVNGHFFVESRLLKKDGSGIPVTMNAVRLPNGLFMAFCSNITERKVLERSQRDSEARFQKILEKAPLPLCYVNVDGLITFRNERFVQIFGYTADDVPTLTEWWHQAYPDAHYRESVTSIWDAALKRATEEGGDIKPVEYTVTCKSGEERIIEISGITLGDDFLATFIDLTERKRAEEALQQMTKFQQSVITNARVWLSVLDNKGTILMWNTAAEEISGYRSAEVIGQNEIWKKIYPDKEYRKQITDTITRIIREDNYLENFETTILSKQGTKKIISWNTRGIPDATGSVSDYIAIGLDVTDRNRAEDALQESEQRMKDIINFLPDATLVIDRNGMVLAWNRAMEVMTGVPADQMIGKGNYEYALPFYHERRPITVDLVLHEDPEVVANYPVMVKDGMSIRSEIFLPHLNEGRGAYLWFTASPLYDSAGNILGAIESIRDITERKQAEEALIKSQGQLAEAMDLAHMVNWEFDVATGVFTFDDRFYALYGTSAAREGGNQMPADEYAKKFVHPDDQYLVAEEVKNAILATDPGYVSHVEHRIIRRDGEVRTIIVRFGIVKDENGRTIKTQGANQDITERKRDEHALQEANKKLNLLSSITRHDISNQLLALNGFLKLLQNKATDPIFEDYFTRITKASSRISAMIRFTKEYEEIGVNAPNWQNTRDLVENAVTEVPLGQITVKNDLPAGIEVFTDPLIVKVFFNLIDNAVRHAGNITTIRFSAEDCDGDHILVCEDDGDGIPADEKEKIFERGFGKNTGLGLSLSREILSITGITIHETGRPGKGARFEITVPKGMYRFAETGEKL
jgi:PAS domain S-box-containing protein